MNQTCGLSSSWDPPPPHHRLSGFTSDLHWSQGWPKIRENPRNSADPRTISLPVISTSCTCEIMIRWSTSLERVLSFPTVVSDWDSNYFWRRTSPIISQKHWGVLIRAGHYLQQGETKFECREIEVFTLPFRRLNVFLITKFPGPCPLIIPTPSVVANDPAQLKHR